MAELNASERLALITENLQEVLNLDLIETILAEGRNPKIYWGMIPQDPAILYNRVTY